MRRTEHQRKVDAAEAELEAMIQVIALEELNRLFRGVQLKLRRINQYRPKAHPNHTRLTKADVTGTSLWDLFKGRLRSRLMEALLGGSISLYSLLTMRVAEQPLELDTDAIARELEYQVGERITQVTNTIKREVGRRIVAWYNSPGVTMQTIINQLRPAFGINRAALIAATETTNLHSLVQTEIMTRLGYDEWWWETKRDNLVCVRPMKGPDGQTYNGCRALHGKRFKLGQPMPPTSSHPGCVLPGQIAAVPGLSAAAESFYSGIVIELSTSSGRRLTVTKNHPILTSRGYTAAQFIHKGDEVITHDRPERIVSSVNPNYHHIPALVEEIFSSLVMTSGMMTTRMPASSKDFHNDGRFINGDINIVYTNGKLPNTFNVSVRKPTNQFFFNSGGMISSSKTRHGVVNSFLECMNLSLRRNMSRFNLMFFNLFCHLRPFQEFGFTLSSNMKMVGNQKKSNCLSCDSKHFSHFVFRNTRFINIYNFLLRQISPSWIRSKNDPVLFENMDYGRRSNVELAHQFCQRESAFIRPDKIVGIKNYFYSGHVYDLQSDMYSLYTVNGIIASNCRCNSHVVIPTVTRPIETPIIDTSHLVKADFVEGEHPRDKGGEFTSKGGEGAGGKMEKPVKVVRSEKKEGEGKDSEGRHTFHGSRFSKTVTEAQRSGIVDAVTKYATVPTHHLEGIEFSVNPKEVYGDDVFLIDSDYSFQDTDGKRFPALYNPETHQVLIIPKFTENIPGYAEEIVHEIGHHVHMTLYPNKYTDDAISEIMKVAKTDYISYDLPGYAFTSPREFMAEVYRKICINKNPTTLNNLAKLFNVNKVEDIWR